MVLLCHNSWEHTMREVESAVKTPLLPSFFFGILSARNKAVFIVLHCAQAGFFSEDISSLSSKTRITTYLEMVTWFANAELTASLSQYLLTVNQICSFCLLHRLVHSSHLKPRTIPSQQSILSLTVFMKNDSTWCSNLLSTQCKQNTKCKN